MDARQTDIALQLQEAILAALEKIILPEDVTYIRVRREVGMSPIDLNTRVIIEHVPEVADILKLAQMS